MHQKKSKIIVNYFLIFILVSSVSNFSLINLISLKDVRFNISGLDDLNNLNIKKNFNKLNIKNIFFLNKSNFSQIINSNPLVENFTVFKKYPSSLEINIEKTNFLAKINLNNKIYIICSNGKLIIDYSVKQNLPFIFGKPDIKKFLSLKKMIDNSKFSYDQIKNLYFFPSKRWDIELNNKVILKLSKIDTSESLNQAFEIYNNKNFKEIKLIDARIANQIIIK